MILSDLVDARILVELRDRLSFAAVARALRMPPATVSRRVMRMEARAGVRLFERTTRSVAATEAGLLSAEHAARILGEVEAVDLSLAAMRAIPVGTVRLTTPTIFGQALLGPLVATFLARYPRCDLAIDLSDRHADLVDEAFDVAVRVGPPGEEALVARALGLVEAGLYCAPGRAVPGLEALSSAPLGLLHPGAAREPTLALVSAAGEQRRLAVQPRLVTMNPWLLRDSAIASDLVVVLPTVVAMPEVDAGRLVQVLPNWFARRVPVHIAFTSRRLIRPAVRAFVDLAVEIIPALLKTDA
ncbi:MAG: LysR family transcriptional regulator [Rhodospirillales bacterium]